jgi:hypothetical protein
MKSPFFSLFAVIGTKQSCLQGPMGWVELMGIGRSRSYEHIRLIPF